MSFHCGEEDNQVPSEAALRFCKGTLAPDYAAAGESEKLQVGFQ